MLVFSKELLSGDFSSEEGQKSLVELVLREYPDLIADEESPPTKRSRQTTEKPDYWTSVWGKMLTNPDIEDPTSFVARKFRRRFRIPYPLFKEVIFPQCVEKNVFDMKRTSTIPIEFKVLTALRILGRDAVADDCAELSFIGESTCHTIFKQFVTNYSRCFYSEYVHFPTGDELLESMEMYRRVGFPGCVGSIDCTHVKWSACQKDKKWKATGKESYPTLSFQAIVSHDRRCLHLSVGFLGSYNDITVSKNDIPVQEIVAGSLADLEYILYDEGGIPKLCKGGYLMSDNGYLKQSVFMCPWKTPSSRQELLWSEWAESVRKDVECFFGIMKARWWYLRNGIRYHGAETIQSAFQCASIFHNMLLAFDGFAFFGEKQWENLNPDEPDDEAFFADEGTVGEREDMYDVPVLTAACALTMQKLQERKDFFMKGPSYHPSRDFIVLRRALVTHFNHQYGIGDLWWPRAMHKRMRVRLRIPPMDLRVLAASRAALYHCPSNLRARDRNKQTYTSRIGDGLFSSIAYKPGDFICKFSGDFISTDERLKRQENGRGGYMLWVNRWECLDCYANYAAGKCYASFANSPRLVRLHNDPVTKVSANSTLKVNTTQRTHTLLAARYISPHTEILWLYNDEYIYPIPEN